MGEEEEKRRCEYWLPKKKRYCANTRLHADSLYCGNHTTRSDADWIPCPIDPSHQVLQQNLEAHLKKCPLLKQAHSLSLEPYYQKGINSGIPDDDDDDGGGGGGDSVTSSQMKRILVHSLTLPYFSALLSKIRAIHASVCQHIPFSYNIPQPCHLWINTQLDRKLPYQEKHVLQQASILGNLEDVGVLSSPKQRCDDPYLYSNENDVSAVVEFGAGRGYLTQILADCYGITKVFLVERKSYKLKADRSLRQKEGLTLERLSIDIEDLNLNDVHSLRGMPYVAIGKHLCGPATDLTLRCCLAGKHGQENKKEQNVRQNLRGIAVATCCHHLCQWKHYINRRYLMELGISKDDFHAMTWFTSWAVDADHGSNLSGDGLQQLPAPPGGGGDSPEDAESIEDLIRNMKPSDRALLGFMCKDIIDKGRWLWVKECGLESKLVYYVPSDISPENHLIVGRAK